MMMLCVIVFIGYCVVDVIALVVWLMLLLVLLLVWW